ncbi:response regulator transcription factor [Cohnella nanjingensis]|uniref:Response regulator transcription factor n=1 Tax=Cohnella nanjingensis TaxID=1387779 RepID=A0A7X0VGL4_9BACL|nr:response regulator transcription factor [Cohnella nanjingensis]MBB6672473.1 response regulator transcription factor [Cohnella nanjingensis]
MYSTIVVDDEYYVRKGLIQLIDWEKSGFQVIGEAENGEDALALIRDRRPDLVVTDIRMPELDGIELIRTAADQKLDTEFMIVSGYNDFQYAQQALRHGASDYVLKPVDPDDATEALAKIRGKLEAKKRWRDAGSSRTEDKRLEAAIRGEYVSSELQAWESSWREAGALRFQYALVEWNDALPWNDRTLPPPETRRSAIRAAVIGAASATREPVLYEHRKAIGLLVPDLYLTEYGGADRSFFAAMLGRLNERLDLNFRVYVGPAVGSLRELNRSYIGARVAMVYKYWRPQTPILLHEEIEGTTLHHRQLEDETYREWMEAIEENDEKAILIALDRMFASFQDDRFSPEAIKAAIVQCALGIAHAVRRAEGDEKELAGMEAVIGWPDYNVTLGELRRLFEAYTFEAAALLNKLYRTHGRCGIRQIICYVDQNFHRPLTLKSAAAHFYMNSAYLGQLFKKHCGVYFNDYVLQLRIAEAKRLLRQSSLRVYEVADRVGFNNADYFVTRFEKLEKMTPTEYRNRLNVDSEG